MKEKGYIKAIDLTIIDELMNDKSDSILIKEIEIIKVEDTKTFNFEVAEYHSYFVSESRILVHNTSGQGPEATVLTNSFARFLNSGKNYFKADGWSTTNWRTDAEGVMTGILNGEPGKINFQRNTLGSESLTLTPNGNLEMKVVNKDGKQINKKELSNVNDFKKLFSEGNRNIDYSDVNDYNSLKSMLQDKVSKFYNNARYENGGPLRLKGESVEAYKLRVNQYGQGKFNYESIVQGIADSPPRKPALECNAATTVMAFKQAGLIAPDLTGPQIERMYTDLNGKPTSSDGVCFDKNANHDLRGLDHGSILTYLNNQTLQAELNKFKNTDWAKLTGMDEVDLQVKPLSIKTTGKEKITEIVNSGYPVQFRSNTGIIYSNSSHFVSARYIQNSSTDGLFFYNDPYKPINNQNRKIQFDWNESIKPKKLKPQGEFSWAIIPK